MSKKEIILVLLQYFLDRPQRAYSVMEIYLEHHQYSYSNIHLSLQTLVAHGFLKAEAKSYKLNLVILRKAHDHFEKVRKEFLKL